MEGMSIKKKAWQTAETSKFWNDIALGEHVLQVYWKEQDLIDTLFHYASEGLANGDSVVVIATPEHIQLLDVKLRNAGHNLFNLILLDQYIPINASYALSEFMIHGSPDPILFRIRILEVLKRALRNGNRVRAFGEMVSLLCERGSHEAAHRLEDLWNILREEQPMTLFCGYLMSDESQDPAAIANAYCQHNRQLKAEQHPNKVYYSASQR